MAQSMVINRSTCVNRLVLTSFLPAAGTLSQASQSKRRQLAPTGLLTPKSHELYGISAMPKCGLVSNGRPKVATITRVGGRKQMISWVDAPDDVFFIATDMTRSVVPPCLVLDAYSFS